MGEARNSGADAIESMLAQVRSTALPPTPPAAARTSGGAAPSAARPLWSGVAGSRSRLGWLGSRTAFGIGGLLLGLLLGQFWQWMQFEQDRSMALAGATRMAQQRSVGTVGSLTAPAASTPAAEPTAQAVPKPAEVAPVPAAAAIAPELPASGAAPAPRPDSPGARCRNAPSGEFRSCVEQQCQRPRFKGHRQCAAVGAGR